MDKLFSVSVIIPSYNRFQYLLRCIQSCQDQTYKPYEIVVVNDGSTQIEYKSHNWDNVKIIHLDQNSKELFGYGNVGYVRNIGIENSSGDYIAFCDDDDIWLPDKIELQVNALSLEPKCDMCCTDGYIGSGIYQNNKNYKKYNKEYYYSIIKKKYEKSKSKYMEDGYPKIWMLEFIKIHNCIITSSVLMKKSILTKINNMPYKKRGQDYLCWKNSMKFTDCVYVNRPCVYYDTNHGDGQNH